MTRPEATTIDVPESSGSKGKAVVVEHNLHGKGKRWLSIFDLILRVSAMVAALAAAAAMGTSGQDLSFVTQFFRFSAAYDDLPTLQFFVIAMAITTSYLLLSIPFSIVCLVRPHAVGPRLLLVILDSVVLVFTASATASSTAIVHLAHNGNVKANWLAVCNQFNDFCQQTSQALLAGFGAVVMLLLLVLLSGFALRRH